MSINLLDDEVREELLSKLDHLSYQQLDSIKAVIVELYTKLEVFNISEHDLFDIDAVVGNLMENYESE